MARTKILFYRELDGSIPVLEWLRNLPDKPRTKCIAKIARLAEMGHELRRPETDFLRNKIYELRIGLDGINYRILYFFHGNIAAVLAHAITKEKKVPFAAIEKAIQRKLQFETNPEKHKHEGIYQ